MIDIYYQNVRGMRTKTNEIYNNILLCSYDVIIFTETWLNSGVMNNEFIDARYMVYRRDRQHQVKKDGGGVLIAVSKNLVSSRMSYWETECEDLWVQVTLNLGGTSKKIAFCAVYLSPSCSSDLYLKLFCNVENIINQNDDVVIMGDFNLSNIRWMKGYSGTHMIPQIYSSVTECALVDFLSANGFYF